MLNNAEISIVRQISIVNMWKVRVHL